MAFIHNAKEPGSRAHGIETTSKKTAEYPIPM
jgi:hypothetical protein